MNSMNFNELKYFNKSIFKYFMLNLALFLISIFVTEVVLHCHPQYAITRFEALSSQMDSNNIQNVYEIFVYIFLSNTIVCIVGILSGMIPFLFIPTFICINNGYNAGLLIAIGEINNKDILNLFLFGVIPHAIVEIPALVYACSIGMYLCKNKTFSIIGKETKKTYNSEIKSAFMRIILPLLLIAATIEVFITPKLIMLLK